MAVTESSKWVAPDKLPCALFSNILHDMSEHISMVWDIQLDTDELDLRYSDLTAKTVGLDSLYSVLGLFKHFVLNGVENKMVVSLEKTSLSPILCA